MFMSLGVIYLSSIKKEMFDCIRTGEFLFARRYCHGGEISALDVSGQIIVSGSRYGTASV